jgi:calcium-translocating P-type ATPase
MNDQRVDWHALEAKQALARLDSAEQGLSAEQAEQGLARHGPNSLPKARRRPGLIRFLAQFHNVLIYVLLAAGILAAALGHMIDAIVILAVVLINAAIGFIQEGKAEKAMDAIGQMLALKARVRRAGKWQDMAAENLVPGDIVKIAAGDRIPADLRLLEAHGLRIDQAALTGESMPVGKDADAVADDTELADRRCMVYSGSMATNGQAIAVVTVTGSETELGRISGMLEQVTTLTTPLLRKINRFAKALTAIILASTALVILLGGLVHALPFADGLLAGIALAVAAIPEGLPAIITITLAIGVQQMARRKAIIRRLPAVETLGSVDIICSDKTGTLTRNELKVRAVAMTGATVHPENESLSGDGAKSLLRAAILCNDFEPDADGGDPIERALVELAQDQGEEISAVREENKRLSLIPFSSDHKYMANLSPGLITLKGAPEALLERCTAQASESSDTQAIDRDFWHQQLDELTGEGLRVLAMAEKTVASDKDTLDQDQDLAELTLLGLVGFADPPRPDVPDAVSACQRAGIRVKMITGDHAATALAIARELKITSNDGRALTGRDIDQLDEPGLQDAVAEIDVFARTTPEHKLRLVKALQAHGHVVAMTGDGANDAPALKRADIGVAMGIKGTEASRQAAEMVLADDHFATIVAGVEEGRGVYDNIRKAVLFLLPTNAAQALVIVLAVLAGLTLPITPVQILWVNMAIAITLALALAFEPLEDDVMLRKPRPIEQGLMTSFVIARVMWVGAVLTAGTFLLYNWVLQSTGQEDLARTMAVNVLVAGQLTYLYNCRRWQQSSLSPSVLFTNLWAWLASGMLLIMQLLFTYLPAAQSIFSTTALPLDYWLIVIAFGILVFFLVETEKLITRRLSLAWASPGGT